MSTTANVWGSLALEKFAQKFETEKVTGSTRIAMQQGTSSVADRSYRWSATGGGKLMLPWPDGSVSSVAANGSGGIRLSHEGKGKPWITLQSLAAVPLKAPVSSGYRITKTLQAIEQKERGKYSRGDIVRVTLEVDAQSDMTWVVLTDPIPAGASVLGSGLGRDSAIALNASTGSGGAAPNNNRAWLAYEERSFESYRAYYQFVPKGKFSVSYTLRFNNAGEFSLPQTRVEAMYAPEMFGESPNAAIRVK
jgi:uncharacterized protein YfaS (alpha-2-macroglobulin family)